MYPSRNSENDACNMETQWIVQMCQVMDCVFNPLKPLTHYESLRILCMPHIVFVQFELVQAFNMLQIYEHQCFRDIRNMHTYLMGFYTGSRMKKDALLETTRPIMLLVHHAKSQVESVAVSEIKSIKSINLTLCLKQMFRGTLQSKCVSLLLFWIIVPYGYFNVREVGLFYDKIFPFLLYINVIYDYIKAFV